MYCNDQLYCFISATLILFLCLEYFLFKIKFGEQKYEF